MQKSFFMQTPSVIRKAVEEKAIKKIDRLEIDNLFGRFNYSLKLDHGISILTAPNGYGKSTILKIIQSFASGDHYYFIREKFDNIRFYLSDGNVVEITRLEGDAESNQVTIRCSGLAAKIKDPFESDEKNFFIERYLTFLTRVGPNAWRHDRSGNVLTRQDIVARYGNHPTLRRKIKREPWVDSILSSLRVFSIPTNRLKLDEDFDFGGQSAGGPGQLMVGSIAKDIQERIQIAIRNQFEEGRKKETSFPNRLIDSLRAGITPERDSIADSIKSVQEYEERYSRLGLVPHTGTTRQLNYQPESTENAGMLVLKTYLEDIREKFSLLEGLAKQLDVFCGSLNKLLAFKYVETSADEGIVVKVIDGTNEKIALSALSSGEQHLIVLFGKLVFNTAPGTLVLIDEPEISFHPEWQEKFLGILEDIKNVNGFSTLVATHSPILIGDRWEDVVELAEQHSASEKLVSPGGEGR